MEKNKIQKNIKENQKKLCKINNKQRGITLIALVVTIVVLLILAGVSISLILDNNGIIGKSKDAKNKYAQSRTNEQSDLEDASDWIDELITGEPRPKKVAVNTEATDNGTINGRKATSNNPIIPKGYIPIDTDTSKWGDGSTAPTQNDVDHGLVIKDGEENEWVWIPVPDVTLMCDTSNTIEYTLHGMDNVTTTIYSKPIQIATDSDSINPYENEESGASPRVVPGNIRGNREPDVIGGYVEGDDSQKEYYNGIMGFSSKEEMAETFVQDYKNMINSIKKYGGFYIGRYELSAEGVKKDQQTLNLIKWYELYVKCKDLNVNENVEIGMIWGCQWDMACNFIVSRGEKKDIIDSRSWGNYANSISPADTGNYEKDTNGYGAVRKNTGSNEAWKANNIYDLAGNCNEWTQEAGTSRVDRGGNYMDVGASAFGKWSGFRTYHTFNRVRYSSNSNSKIIYTVNKKTIRENELLK